MTDDEYNRAAPVIAMAQRLEGKLHDQLLAKGVLMIDVMIAATYSAHECATKVHGDPFAAIEWMRDVLDTIERQLMERPR